MRPATCSGRRPRRQGPRTRSNKPRRSRRSCWRLQSGHAVSPFDHNRRLNQAASLDRLAEFVEVRRTVIGTDVSVLLTAADGPGATRLFSDLGALAIPFEATATIGDIHYLAAGDGNQTSVVEAWAPVYTGGFGLSTSTNRWRRGRKPPTAIRMATRVPGPGPREHEPSSGMMGKDSMSSAMNIWEVKCGEVHPRGRNSAVAGCCRQQPVEPAAAGATPDSKGAVRRVRSITGPPTL